MKRMFHNAAALAASRLFAASSRRIASTGHHSARSAGGRRALFRRGHGFSLDGPEWSADDIAALRQKVKYVFVIFNENRSFDHEYGTLPGVNGLYSDGKAPRSPADTPGFTESYLDTKPARR